MFGLKTQSAVKVFQRKNGLSADELWVHERGRGCFHRQEGEGLSPLSSCL
nr:peptidoglycan-binding domain-containing protein [Thermoactinomyces sp. DSM 45892]